MTAPDNIISKDLRKALGLPKKTYSETLAEYVQNPSSETFYNLQAWEARVVHSSVLTLHEKNQIVKSFVAQRQAVLNGAQGELKSRFASQFSKLDESIAGVKDMRVIDTIFADAVLYVFQKYGHFIAEDGTDKTEEFFQLIVQVDALELKLRYMEDVLCSNCNRDGCYGTYGICGNNDEKEENQELRKDIKKIKDLLAYRFSQSYNENDYKEEIEKLKKSLFVASRRGREGMRKSLIEQASFAELFEQIENFAKGGVAEAPEIPIDKTEDVCLSLCSSIQKEVQRNGFRPETEENAQNTQKINPNSIENLPYIFYILQSKIWFPTTRKDVVLGGLFSALKFQVFTNQVFTNLNIKPKVTIFEQVAQTLQKNKKSEGQR